MTTPETPQATRRPAGVAKLVVMAAIFALLLSSCFTSQQNAVAKYVNNSRSSHSVPKVKQNRQLTNKAQSWAEYLSRIGRLNHSSLSKGITQKWKALGENVGYGSSIKRVHNSYMNSSGHRANILAGKFNYIGTGWAKKNGRVYTVQVFMKK